MKDFNIFMTELFPYLEGEELKNLTLTLTIKDIRQEKMKSQGGREESKYVLYFSETPKGFVLNKTNAKRVAVLHGKMTGGWAGKQITLYTEEVRAFGETHNALRVAIAVNSDNSNGEMNLAKLLYNLNRVERIEGFYSETSIMDCRGKGAEPPASDDTDGWRVLFVDARDHAFSELDRAIEDGKILNSDSGFGQVEPGHGFVTDHGGSEPQSGMDEVEMDEDAQMSADAGQTDAHGPDMRSDETAPF